MAREERIFLHSRISGLVPAVIRHEIAYADLDDYVRHWQPVFEELQEASRYGSDAAEDGHWDWHHKAEQALSHNAACLAVRTRGEDGMLQGLMILYLHEDGYPSSLEPGLRIPYLAYISTAPWNRGLTHEHEALRGVGWNLLRKAVEISRENGFLGRLMLHSLPAAESFYKRHHFDMCGYDMSSEAMARRLDGMPIYELSVEGAAYLAGDDVSD